MEHKSRDEKKHIVTKDMVGLLLSRERRGSEYENNSTYRRKKNTHIVAKDVVGLQVGDDDSLTKIKTY